MIDQGKSSEKMLYWTTQLVHEGEVRSWDIVTMGISDVTSSFSLIFTPLALQYKPDTHTYTHSFC